MRSLCITALLLVVITPAALAQDALAALVAGANPRTISTSGEAVVYVVPDEVVVGLGIETFDKDLDKAKSKNDEGAAKLLKAIRELKIEEKHIHTDVMQVEIRYISSTHLVIDGFVTRRAYSITLKDVKLFEKLVDTAIRNGANQLQGFEFKTTELRKHRDEARKMAIKAAKEKAQDLAKELECKVAKPRTITEGYANVGYGWNRYNWAQNSFQNAAQVVGGGAAEGEQTMPLGQIGVRASVSVTFDLEP